MKLIKYFLQRRSVTILLLLLVLAGGIFAYIKMGKLEDAPFTIKQALVLTPYPGASPSEVQSQVTDVLEEAIQSMGELYYLKTENRAGISTGKAAFSAGAPQKSDKPGALFVEFLQNSFLFHFCPL